MPPDRQQQDIPQDSQGNEHEAFQACRYIIDQLKVRLPIWKKEHYVDGHSGWVNCERCAKSA